MRSLFVTGTDTDVGKTTVSRALLLAAARRGMRVAAMKPIETGCSRPGLAKRVWGQGGRLIASDALRLTRGLPNALTGDQAAYDHVCPYRFEPPVSPSVASREAGVDIALKVIDRAHQAIVALAPDFLLVEGAGGLLVPIDDRSTTIADVALYLGHPLLVVVRDRLGAINHTLLTVEVAQARGLTVSGVVLNRVDLAEVVPSNLDELRRHCPVPVLGALPQLRPAFSPFGRAWRRVLGSDDGECIEEALDLDLILGRKPGPDERDTWRPRRL